MNLLVVDNFDSFTYMLVDYLRQAGARCRVVRNNDSWSALTQPADGVVLSPGPGRPADAGQLMAVIDHYHRRVPMLGVCLGHQAIGTYFGAQLTTADRPMHGKVSVIATDPADPLFAGLATNRFGVTRYHSLVLQALPPDLVCTARTDTAEIMALRHQYLPLWGVQFHPEAALSDNGLTILANWVNFVNYGRNAGDEPSLSRFINQTVPL